MQVIAGKVHELNKIGINQIYVLPYMTIPEVEFSEGCQDRSVELH